MAKTTVKVAVLGLLEKGPRRFSELAKELERPDKTVCVALKDLAKLELVTKDEKGRWAVTKEGRLELRRAEFVNAVLVEDDMYLIERMADLYAVLKRTTKSSQGLRNSTPPVKGSMGLPENWK